MSNKYQPLVNQNFYLYHIALYQDGSRIFDTIFRAKFLKDHYIKHTYDGDIIKLDCSNCIEEHNWGKPGDNLRYKEQKRPSIKLMFKTKSNEKVEIWLWRI